MKVPHRVMQHLRFQRIERERTDLPILCRGNGQIISGQDT